MICCLVFTTIIPAVSFLLGVIATATSIRRRSACTRIVWGEAEMEIIIRDKKGRIIEYVSRQIKSAMAHYAGEAVISVLQDKNDYR